MPAAAIRRPARLPGLISWTVCTHYLQKGCRLVSLLFQQAFMLHQLCQAWCHQRHRRNLPTDRSDPGVEISPSQLKAGAGSTAQPERPLPVSVPDEPRGPGLPGTRGPHPATASWCRATQGGVFGFKLPFLKELMQAHSGRAPRQLWALPKPQHGGFGKAQRMSQNPLSPLQFQRQ